MNISEALNQLKAECEAGFARIVVTESVVSDSVVCADLGKSIAAAEQAAPIPASEGVVVSTTFHLVTGIPEVLWTNPDLIDDYDHICATPEEAIEAFREAFERFRDAHPGNTLFWRKPPALRTYTNPLRDDPEKYYVAARVAIGDLQ